jgi:phosphatidate cytidylyltransferase
VLKQRIITALILAPIVVGGLFFLPPLGFAIFTGVLLTLGAWEWANLSGASGAVMRVVYALAIATILGLSIVFSIADYVMPILWLVTAWWLFSLFLIIQYPSATALWRPPAVRLLMGLPVLVGAWLGLNYLRTGDFSLGRLDNNLLLILFGFCVVWIADIGAYFAGRAWGKRKLAPRVSPGKSWAGVYGGLVAALSLGLIVAWLAQCTLAETLALLVVSGITALISVLGDLYESMLKRFRGVKDSSQLLPGHGGILDRVDSLTAALPVFALQLTLAGWLAPAAIG